MPQPLNYYNRIAGIFFLGIGIFFSLYSRSVEIGTWNEPGPGFLPFWAGITLSIMAAFLLIGSFKGRGPLRPSFFPEAASWKRVLMTFLALIAYNFLLTPLGFFLTTLLFIGFLLRFIFPQTIPRTLIVAFASAIVARLLFINFLETQLPKGFLGF